MDRSNFHQQCIAACYACADACDHCAIACLNESDPADMARCIASDIDCAQICRTAAAFLARGSEHDGTLCAACAHVCRGCAEVCGKHSFGHCQECAAACRQCAELCEKLAREHVRLHVDNPADYTQTHTHPVA